MTILLTAPAPLATRSETAEERQMRTAREQFDANFGEHQMTVVMDARDGGPGGVASDGGPYRHIRFARPGTSIWRFDLVTWPGHLTISGDLESFTFKRIHDMFDFFGPTPNPGYWAEKCIAGEVRSRFSVDHYIGQVNEYVEEARGDYSAEQFEDLKRDIHADLIADAPEYVEEAQQRLSDYCYAPVDGQGERGRDFYFSDTWEWRLGGYSHHFLLALHAIARGVAAYRAAHPERIIRER